MNTNICTQCEWLYSGEYLGSFTYYVITEGEGGSSMITLHVIVTWVSTVKVITEGRGVNIGQKLIM